MVNVKSISFFCEPVREKMYYVKGAINFDVIIN